MCVVGLGYIGLPTAALLANKGYYVHGVDTSPAAVSTINRGGVHIVEPDLEVFVKSAIASGRLKAFAEPSAADVFMICVPTPLEEGATGIPAPNLVHVSAAAKAIAPHVRPGNLVILESTSPVGTTLKLRDELQQLGVDVPRVHLAYCPERVLPGRIMIELIENDRVVGGVDAQSAHAVKEFYETFVTGEVFLTDSMTAELCKLVENSFRDVNIAFANELSILCDRMGIDVGRLISLANRHPRVKILQPGCGVGGHCIAVDPWFVVSQDPENAKLIHTARRVNDQKTLWAAEKIKAAARIFERESARRPVIACMGLAFKPDIDDLRESPALAITHGLIRDGYDVLAVEPNIESHPELRLTPWQDALARADIVVWLVKHREFLHATADGTIVLDFCGITGLEVR